MEMGQAGDTRLRSLGLDGDRAEEALRKIQQAEPPDPSRFFLHRLGAGS